jgi:hypothetical protein
MDADVTNQTKLLRWSFWLTIAALMALVLTIIVAVIAGKTARQEDFEFLQNLAGYVEHLRDVSAPLRIVLFLDSIFLLCYTGAIGFVVVAFAENNRPVAMFAGLALTALMVLDIWENLIMVQSIDLVALAGNIDYDRLIYQTTISSIKWHAAAVTLFAVSFILPDETRVENLLVWGTRLGLAIGVPLFVFAPFQARTAGLITIEFSMLGGFILLALITRGRMNRLLSSARG